MLGRVYFVDKQGETYIIINQYASINQTELCHLYKVKKKKCFYNSFQRIVSLREKNLCGKNNYSPDIVTYSDFYLGPPSLMNYKFFCFSNF